MKPRGPQRSCYWVVPMSGDWVVITASAWPDAMGQRFRSCAEGVEVASIVARGEWEQYRRPTRVCTRDARSGIANVQVEFG